MERRELIFLIVILGIAGVVAFAITHSLLHPDSEEAAGQLENFTVLAEKLNLTGDQREEVKKYHEEMMRKLEECCRRHCDARIHLGKALGSGKSDKEKLKASVDKMTEAYRKSELITLEYIRRIRKILNSEQNKRFGQLLEKEICSPCPVCGSKR